MIPDCLETANISLRPFSAEDAEFVFEYWRSDPGWERYNESVPLDFTLSDATTFVAEMCARNRCTSPNWAIVHQTKVVGVVSLTFEQNHKFAVIGYGIHGDLRGRGLSAEAALAVVNQAFDCHQELMKIRAHTEGRNVPSMRVLEKLGFSLEGNLRQNQFVKGRFEDEAVYGLLREDWAAD